MCSAILGVVGQARELWVAYEHVSDKPAFRALKRAKFAFRMGINQLEARDIEAQKRGDATLNDFERITLILMDRVGSLVANYFYHHYTELKHTWIAKDQAWSDTLRINKAAEQLNTALSDIKGNERYENYKRVKAQLQEELNIAQEEWGMSPTSVTHHESFEEGIKRILKQDSIDTVIIRKVLRMIQY